MKSVIELIRVSTAGQAEDDKASIPAQRHVNRTTATRYGLTIVDSVELSDVSGANVLLAPEIQKLLRSIQSPDITGVVTREFSRLMRPDKFTDYVLLQAFADTKTILYLPDGPLDLASKSGRLMGTIRAAIAGLEKTEIQERIFSAKEEMRRRGDHASGAHCLPKGVGYDKANGFHYTPDAERVREAYRLLLSGETNYVTLARTVGLTRNGIRGLLENPIWSGWRVYDQKRDLTVSHTRVGGRQGYRPKIAREENEIIRVKVIDKPLLSDRDFMRAQHIIRAKREQRHRERMKGDPDRYIYNGFLICGICGGPMYTFNRTATAGFFYVCKNKNRRHVNIPVGCASRYQSQHILEPILDEFIGEKFLDIKFLRAMAQANNSAPTNVERDRKTERLRKGIEALQTKRGRVTDSFIEGVIDRAARDSKLVTIDSQIKTMRDGLTREGKVLPKLDAAELSWFFQPFTEWKFLKRQDKRALLSELIPQIKVVNYKVTGFYMWFPTVDGREGGYVEPPEPVFISCDKDSRLKMEQ